MLPDLFKSTLRRMCILTGTAVWFALILSLSRHTTTAQNSQTIYLPLIASPTPFVHSINRLPNPSFEAGWYHPGGIPELQIPQSWTFTWLTGPTGYGNNPWDVWVRPEVRVLPSSQLPPHEHPLFIWDGNQTVKSFKAYGAISFQMTTNVTLEAGKYVFEMSVFPDLVVGYNPDGSKIWAPDPLSGEVKLAAGANSTDWLLPTFGRKNSFYFVFVLFEPQTWPVSAALKGRHAIVNNGWFIDDWWLWRQDDLPLPPGIYTGHGTPFINPPTILYGFPVGESSGQVDE